MALYVWKYVGDVKFPTFLELATQIRAGTS